MSLVRFAEASHALYAEKIRVRECAPRTDEWLSRVSDLDALLVNEAGHSTHAWQTRLREAMTRDDFPLLFSDTASRRMRARFEAADPGMSQICFWRDVVDFRENKTFDLTGVSGRLQEVTEKGERLASHLAENKTSWYLKSYGRQVDISWQALLNGGTMFNDIPLRLTDAATNTREYMITSQLCGAAGPTDATFSIATATAPLSIGALETGIAAMNEQTVTVDTGGVPLVVRPKFLIVPPRLEMTARKILKSTLGVWTYGGDDEAAAVMQPTANVVADFGLQLIVNPWLPIINTTSGNTAWYLAADPQGSCPLLEFGSLQGRRDPELFMKAPTKQAVGGGMINPMEGDFDTDNIFWAVRYTLGGTVLDTRGGYASTGAGS